MSSISNEREFRMTEGGREIDSERENEDGCESKRERMKKIGEISKVFRFVPSIQTEQRQVRKKYKDLWEQIG